MRLTIAILSIVVLFTAAAPGAATERKGAGQMRLEAGGPGPVPFPHARHQSALGDCGICHSLFEQEKGGIAKGIADGRLARKQVMNRLCIQCHRAQKSAGQPSGPLGCTKCHKKD